MRKLSFILTLLVVTSCSALIDGITGRYSRYDANEYNHAVELQLSIQEASNLCSKPTLLGYQVNKIDSKINFLKLYAEGRPHNVRVVNQLELMNKSVEKIKNKVKKKKKISKFYCEEKITNLQTMSDTLRKSIGGKKHD